MSFTSNNPVSKQQRTQAKKSRKNGEGSTYWNKQIGKYESAFKDLNGKIRRKSFLNHDDAVAWRKTMIAERDKGSNTHAENPKETVEEFLARWLASRVRKCRPNTIRAYDIAIRTRINTHIGKIRACQLTPSHIEGLADKLMEMNYKAGSILGVYRTLSKAYNDGVRLGWVPSNPMQRVERLTLESISSIAIPEDDTKALLHTASTNPADLARLIVGIKLGLRPGEVSGLRWSDLDLTNPMEPSITINRQVQYEKGKGLIYGPPKTKRKSAIPLTQKEATALLSHKIHQQLTRARLTIPTKKSGRLLWKGDDQIMFPNTQGNLQNPKSDRNWFNKLCIKAGIKRYQIYQMRKKALTDFMSCADLGVVMAYSGHSQASTLLKHYISPSLEVIRQAAIRRENASESAFRNERLG